MIITIANVLEKHRNVVMTKIVSIDLDGVLNTYNGNFKPGEIAPVKDGAYEFLERLYQNFNIEIYTVRDVELVKKWLAANNLKQFVNEVTNIKNKFSSVILDDRAVNFDGDFSSAYEKIIEFKPYWK